MKRTLSKFRPTLPQHLIGITRLPDTNESLAMNLGGMGNSLKEDLINRRLSCGSISQHQIWNQAAHTTQPEREHN